MQGARDICFVDRRTKVWLECTGEPIDYRAVQVCGVAHADGDAEVVTFSCPRCGRQHESLRFN